MTDDISISNLWRQMEFVCGAPSENGTCGYTMIPEMGYKQVYYKCPHCGCATPYYDIEKFINKASKMIVEDAEDGIESNLTNFKMQVMSRIDKRHHTFTVLLHTHNKLKVSLKND